MMVVIWLFFLLVFVICQFHVVSVFITNDVSVLNTTNCTGNVLVLGSNGLIGRSLTASLVANHYCVTHVMHRRHLDLRNALQTRAALMHHAHTYTFAFFLACEVGGAKFIASSDRAVQRKIVRNNVQMYESVFPLLDKINVSYVFTSSYQQEHPYPYGAVKRIGEQYVSTHGHGRTVRLWNIYGRENITTKSHVLADWAYACYNGGKIHSISDGFEERQFLHANDTARAFITFMQHFDEMPLTTDISSNAWVSMRHIGRLIGSLSTRQCNMTFSTRKALFNKKLEPDVSTPFWRYWTPMISLQSGISDLFAFYSSLGINSTLVARAEHEDL